MSGSHSLDKNVATDSCHSITGEMDVSSLKSMNRNITQDLSHLSHQTERAFDIQSPALHDGLSAVSEECQSSEDLNLKMCIGVGHCVSASGVAVHVDSYEGECVLNSNISEQLDHRLSMTNKPDVVEHGNSCTAAIDACLLNPNETVSDTDHCIGSLIRSNSFTETSSLDRLHLLRAATRKLAGSPKPVLRRHSMTLSRTKKQVKIETNAEVIEIDTGTSQYPEIGSEDVAPINGTEADCIVSKKSEFSRMYIDAVSESDHCQVEQLLFSGCEEVSKTDSCLGNLPISADTSSVIDDSATAWHEVPASSPQKDINATDTDLSPPHAELTAARCRSYELKCVEKTRVRHLVEDDDDSCGDEADDESTANEEELDSECKDEREHKRKRRKSVEDEVEKVVSSSPNGRFLKFDCEIGCGSFKTVYKGLDSETGVHIAWCELQVCNCSVVTYELGYVPGRCVTL